MAEEEKGQVQETTANLLIYYKRDFPNEVGFEIIPKSPEGRKAIKLLKDHLTRIPGIDHIPLDLLSLAQARRLAELIEIIVSGQEIMS